MSSCCKKRLSWDALGGRSFTGRLRELILPYYSELVRLHLECCGQFWTPEHKKDIAILNRVQQRTIEMMKGLRHASMTKDWESWECWTWRKEGSMGILSMDINMWRNDAKKTVRLFSIAPSDRGHEHKVKPKKSYLNIKQHFFHCDGGWALEQVAKGGCNVYICSHIKNPFASDLGNQLEVSLLQKG